MDRTTIATTALLAAAAATLLLAGSASACSCAGPAPGEERAFNRELLKRADGAVIAKMTGRRPLRSARDGVAGPREVVLTYRVRRAFKKRQRFPSGRRLRIRTSAHGSTCGIPGRPGDVHGLVLYRHRGDWRSNLCLLLEPRALRAAARSGAGRAREAVSRPRSRSPRLPARCR